MRTSCTWPLSSSMLHLMVPTQTSCVLDLCYPTMTRRSFLRCPTKSCLSGDILTNACLSMPTALPSVSKNTFRSPLELVRVSASAGMHIITDRSRSCTSCFEDAGSMNAVSGAGMCGKLYEKNRSACQWRSGLARPILGTTLYCPLPFTCGGLAWNISGGSSHGGTAHLCLRACSN